MEASSTMSLHRCSSRCGRWQCGEENSSFQLQPAEEEKLNKAKLSLDGKTRNKTKNTGQDMESIVDISDREHTKCWELWSQMHYQGSFYKSFEKKVLRKLIYSVFLASQVTSLLLYFTPVWTLKSILHVTHRMSE